MADSKNWEEDYLKHIKQMQFSYVINNYHQALRELPKEEHEKIYYYAAISLANHVYLSKNIESKQAEQMLHQAATFMPLSWRVINDVGNAYSNIGKFERARDFFVRAIALAPDEIAGYVNLSFVYHRLGDHEREAFLTKYILEKDPENILGNWHQALWMLLRGEYKKGFEKYEWRYKHPLFIKNNPTGFNLDDKFFKKMWKGESIKSKKVLVFLEQGYGDFIQVARYLPMLKERCSKLIVASYGPCKSLVESMDCVDEVVLIGEDYPKYDKHVFIMSLPHRFRTTLKKLPADVPYFKVPKDKSKFWKDKLVKSKNLKVGFCCAGNPNTTVSRIRACTLKDFAPLFQVEGVDFYSLHVRDYPPDLKEYKEIIDITSDIKDFQDSAALISEMDLVITVETAVAHLAGALNLPVWVILAKTPAWRWLLDRIDSPWYPSASLFRQTEDQDWSSPIKQAQDVLLKLVQDFKK